MKKGFLTSIICLLLTLSMGAEERKKVAVVLSGGGAKGMAHVSALRVIEEAGIPIDMIVGTSMGGLIGGLYAVGYTPDQIDSLAMVQKWSHLLTDNVEMDELSYTDRQRRKKSLITIPFNPKDRSRNRAGLVKGINLEKTFLPLLSSYTDSISFGDLPIRYACVATDILHCKEYVFHHGELYTAMRATMSFPGAFTPVKVDSMLLVDGGIVNNFPIDVARNMGADYVIGVDVQDEERTEEDLNSLPNVIMQIVEIGAVEKYKENVRNTDIYIRVPVKGYNAASFTSEAIDTLLERGENATREKWEELIQLKRELGLPKSYHHRARTHAMIKQTTDSILHSRHKPDPLDTSSVSVGMRFDTEELAAILFDANVKLPVKKPSTMATTLRLGQQIRGRLSYNYNTPSIGTLHTAYQIGYHDNYIYDEGRRAYNITYIHHLGEVSFSSSWRTMQVSMGVRYEYYRIRDLLAGNNYTIEETVRSEGYLSYFAGLEYDNLNRKSFPTKGRRWSIRANVYTDNFVGYKEEIPILAVQAAWERAITLIGEKRLVLHPFLHGRALITDTRPYSLYNYIGGQFHGKYMTQQLPFIGVNYTETASQYLGIAGFKLSNYIGNNSYLTLIGNYGISAGRETDTQKDFDTEHLLGTGLTYGYDTVIGPIEATFSYSNRTKKVAFFVNLGFNF